MDQSGEVAAETLDDVLRPGRRFRLYVKPQPGGRPPSYAAADYFDAIVSGNNEHGVMFLMLNSTAYASRVYQFVGWDALQNAVLVPTSA